MEFDRNEQDEDPLEKQVNEIFKDLSSKSTEERMAIAAFHLMNYIDKERRASQAAFEVWLKHGKSNAESVPRVRVGGLIIAGFANMAYAALPPKEKLPEDIDKEVAAKEKNLELANLAVQSERMKMPSMYGLSPREVKRAEAKARKLTPPKNT